MEYKISDLCDIRRGASPRPIKNYIVNSYDNSLPWVKIADATKDSSRYIYDTKERVSLEGSKKSVEVLPGDLILSNSATPGLPKFMKVKACIHDGWLLLRNFKNVRKEFLYYILLLNRQKLLQLSNGSVFNNLKTDIVKNYIVDIPSIKKQDKILKIIGNIEDKLDTNNKLIANLEELSQTLFKHWFVDFEFPDKNGNPYKSSGGEMIDSELGKIPDSWKIYKLKDVASHKKETFNPKKSEEVTVKHFSLPAYDNEEQAINEEVNKIKSNKWIINNNCVLFSKMNPDTKRVWLPLIDNKKINVASSEFVVMESPNNKINSFVYNICLNSQFIDYLKANTTGSTNSRQRVKPTIAVNYKLAIEDSIVKNYSEIITPYMEKMKILRSEIGKLTQLRDTLLPKLMSGELEIPDDVEVNTDELSI
ncbi:TPA: restriction endonuclease subunit S [Staphylococcus aureus]|uniref:restriction endonuclease subunit S n=1 Tax=Staphylococcus epidermidis TaxID=1282 RepID=UPI000C1A4DC3|nr:restriction endonuclease subunit S [Staphylococcus epidermidis]HAR6679703.1 restriction endonuclease subunit S [Staphylococcus aureus]MBE7347535.1 restriction endonuclease subunit S [Staphylococcus epidermidis]MBF2141318.1 restriction endonuclease subunit S [Staphylococcus epidermidis]MBM6160559.1 restriction endonuclease subunit S [Staphylococcus epidermidis]MBM6162457.1 restriction endonuclease subunit S [Staphylococcus epidermidis]